MKYIKKRFFCNIIFILTMVFSPVLIADEAEYQFGFSLVDFDYTEYDDNNVFLDGETGLIPGVVLKVKKNKEKSFSEWVGSLYYNKINYDGQTAQSGIPLTTTSDALVIDTHFKLGRYFNHLSGRDQAVYGGLGYRYWFRNIHPGQDLNGNPVAGILEEYYWPYILLGFQGNLMKEQGFDVGIDLRYTKMVSAKMNIDFLGFCNYDNTSVELGNRNGWRFSLPIKRKLEHKSTLFITPYYEIIDIGKSNTVLLTRNGSLVDCDNDGFLDGALEPRSETRNVGIEITWLW